MRPIRDTIPLAEALAQVRAAAAPIERTEVVSLLDAVDRVVAVEVRAEADVPPFDRAAMDGYAVVAQDTFGAGRTEPSVLACLEKVYTGQMPTRAVSPGTCIEIATGAPMPECADAVVRVEDTEQAGTATVHVLTPVYPRQNVGRRAADIRQGQLVSNPGEVLNPARIGALAACGLSSVAVYARPRVAILSTGNEIVEPGQPLAPGQIYDINKVTLATIVKQQGGEAVLYPTAADTLDELERAVDASLADDILVFSGGSSVGERDLILDVITRKGEVAFHGIAVKPGKPTVFGHIGGKPVLGMPGYPTSCLSNAYMLLTPLLRLMARLPAHQPRVVTLPLAQRIVSTTGRHQFYTVRVVDGAAQPAFKASGDITSMSQADGYIEIAAQTDIVEKGEMVDVKLF
jgi:molybdenum cofactor synthesis domain-containing protein